MPTLQIVLFLAKLKLVLQQSSYYYYGTRGYILDLNARPKGVENLLMKIKHNTRLVLHYPNGLSGVAGNSKHEWKIYAVDETEKETMIFGLLIEGKHARCIIKGGETQNADFGNPWKKAFVQGHNITIWFLRNTTPKALIFLGNNFSPFRICPLLEIEITKNAIDYRLRYEHQDMDTKYKLQMLQYTADKALNFSGTSLQRSDVNAGENLEETSYSLHTHCSIIQNYEHVSTLTCSSGSQLKILYREEPSENIQSLESNLENVLVVFEMVDAKQFVVYGTDSSKNPQGKKSLLITGNNPCTSGGKIKVKLIVKFDKEVKIVVTQVDSDKLIATTDFASNKSLSNVSFVQYLMGKNIKLEQVEEKNCHYYQ